MKKLVITMFAIGLSVGLVSCASSDEENAHVQVLPSEYGLHRVVAKDYDRYTAEANAVDAAKEYCAERDQEAVFGGSVGATSRYLAYAESSNREKISNITFRCR